METKKYKGKALYQPAGKAGEYAKWACNFYNGCSNQCEYCYLRRGVLNHVWSGFPALKKCFKDEDDAINRFRAECEKNIEQLRKHGVFFTFTSDPFLKETRSMTIGASEIAGGMGISSMFLTKRADFVDYIEGSSLMMGDKGKFCFGFTLTGHDEMEPFASRNTERIKAMQKLHDMGFMTFASIEPVIDFGSSYDVIEKSFGCCDLFKIGLRSGVKKGTYTAEGVYEFMKRVDSLFMGKDINTPKVYWKKSMKEYLPETSPLYRRPYSVGADYTLFKNK